MPGRVIAEYDHLDYYPEYHELSHREQKLADGKKEFVVCDQYGNPVTSKPVWNRYPAGAARKGVSRGLTKIAVYSPENDKWYFYMGRRIKIRKPTEHQYLHDMNYKSKARRARENELHHFSSLLPEYFY